MGLSKPFAIDTWCRTHKVHSCVAPLSLTELAELSGGASSTNPLGLNDITLDYGSVLGSQELRENIAAMFKKDTNSPISWQDVIITTGAISANFLVLDTLVGPGDHVICQYPTYQQLYEVPKRQGAQVDLWKLKEEENWSLDVTELSTMTRPNTKMIIINNPCNPSGTAISRETLQAIVDFAKPRGITILCDEVFSPLFYDKEPPSILEMGYSNVISTRSCSKGMSLPGIRLGWIASPNKEIMKQAAASRDYTTVAVSKLDDRVAAFALSDSIRPKVIKRSIELCKTDIALLEQFVAKHKHICSWVKPNAGATAFIKISRNGQPVDDVAFCKDVLEKVQLLLIPGGYTFGTEAEDFKGYVRIGFVVQPEYFASALGMLEEYFTKFF
ncbi:hypothetical protein BP5796_05242 [Coleophoma crateriformis]|uniref:Aminotransferase class I/classII large domain-containing protein n=1 Tax=Coleophoma crateriformis TaxID=565419 RepID=A0A3D8S396_9HELO|nr:hypothetical protein BP5796_05242 [Coleophoma crateriformis]